MTTTEELEATLPVMQNQTLLTRMTARSVPNFVFFFCPQIWHNSLNSEIYFEKNIAN